jgi:hypothetical protein
MKLFTLGVLFVVLGCGHSEPPVPEMARKAVTAPAPPPPIDKGTPPAAKNPPPPAPPPPAAPPRIVPGLAAAVGTSGPVKKVRSLLIDKPGVYENFLVDAEFGEHDAVRIKADHVVLRNCEIRNGQRDGIEVYGSDVLIENCSIHHFLNGKFKPQLDGHGITGQPTRLTIRNCDIAYVSGDCIQFDPGRKPWTDVLIDHCVLRTGPLPEDAGGFKKGERPGENAVDTKQSGSNPRSRLTIRNTVCHGWQQPAQIENAAALNLKNHVDVRVENCVFYDNEISLRLRGPGGSVGGAWVTVTDSAFYSSDVAIRLEDRIERTRIVNPLFGAGVKERYWGEKRTGPGTEIGEGGDAPPLGTRLGRD